MSSVSPGGGRGVREEAPRGSFAGRGGKGAREHGLSSMIARPYLGNSLIGREHRSAPHCAARGFLPTVVRACEVVHMVRAIRDAPAVAPAPESLQGMLRMAAQLEALADSQAPHRMAAARAILPPVKAANRTKEVITGTKVVVKTLPATPSPATWQAASPQLGALLPFFLLLVVLVVVPALLLVLRVVRRAMQGADLRAATPDAAASREPKRMPEGAGGGQPKTAPPSAALIAVDNELVLELVLSSQEGSNGRPRQQLLQRARQLSRRHAPPASALAPPHCLSRARSLCPRDAVGGDASPRCGKPSRPQPPSGRPQRATRHRLHWSRSRRAMARRAALSYSWARDLLQFYAAGNGATLPRATKETEHAPKMCSYRLLHQIGYTREAHTRHTHTCIPVV